METIQYNVNRAPDSIRERITPRDLYWGDQAHEFENDGYDFVIGSDLIYAHEVHEPLSQTYRILTEKVLPSGKHPVGYLAVIRRFKWEENFFEMMTKIFKVETVLEFQEIAIYRYTRLEDVETEEDLD